MVSIGFYNVENLFDTINSPGIRDGEFTPEGSKAYTSKIYNEKIANLGKVINAFDGGAPDVLGVAEIENRNVLEDLCQAQLPNHKIVHYNSPDGRGIDVAILYNYSTVEIEKSYPIGVKMADNANFKTRDILCVEAIYKPANKDFTFYVNHWPSRVGGEKESAPKRYLAASVLKASVDSALQENPDERIVIMGDFNDEPTDSSLVYGLKAVSLGQIKGHYDLLNLSYKLQEEGLGTYNYRGDYNMLDQFIVSKPLTRNTTHTIVKHDWMMYVPKSGVPVPSRSYGGNTYYGGYSDHLPIQLFVKF